MSDKRAIGVFDSGVGGLTVLSAIHKVLPAESTVYLGDLARLPYGTKSSQTVIRYALNSAKALCALGQIKILVVACSTATAHALEALQDALSIPVIGTIEPAAQAALAHKDLNSIAVLATPATVQSKAFEVALRKGGYTGIIQQQACPLFVPIVEEGMVAGPIAAMIAGHYLGFLPSNIDAAILGCTHYPALAPLLRDMMPPSVKWIDSNEATARAAERLLRERGLLNDNTFVPERKYFVTDAASRLEQLSELFMHKRIERSQVELIDL